MIGRGPTVRELRATTARWRLRPPPGIPTPILDTDDWDDGSAWASIVDDAPALAELDHDLVKEFGTPGLVADLWTTAYTQEPRLCAAEDTSYDQRIHRAVLAAMLDSPEHNRLREYTVGDPYAAAMAVLAQAPAVRQMLERLDPEGRQEAAQRARRQANTAANEVRRAFAAAQEAAAEKAGQPEPDPNAPGGDSGTDTSLDGVRVPRPNFVAIERAVADADALDAELELAQQALADLGEQDQGGVQAALELRPAGREACEKAIREVAKHAAVMAAWGIGPGQACNVDPKTRMALAAKFSGKKLKRFAELVGRLKFLARAQRARRVDHARGEYVDVTLGNDLNSLIPSALIQLTHPLGRAEFVLAYSENRLPIYDQRGEENAGQGAIIACVDCSGSMLIPDERGISSEMYAKALCLALLEQARNARPTRQFVAILFSHRVEATIAFPANRPVDVADKLSLAATFPAGGTSFTDPLEHAIKLLEEEYNTTRKGRADIVFLTDGHADFTQRWLDWWGKKKTSLGFRCYGVRVGPQAGTDHPASLKAICDDLRHVQDLADADAMGDIFSTI